MSAGGRIIMNSSNSSKMANGDPFLLHCCSKAAMDFIARNLAVIYGPSLGITVNSIGCGCSDTETMKRSIQVNGPEFGQLVENLSPLKRLGQPEEVANIISFVASPEASWINGNQVPANGGMMLALQG